MTALAKYNSLLLKYDAFDGNSAEIQYDQVSFNTLNVTPVKIGDKLPENQSLVCYHLDCQAQGQPSNDNYDKFNVKAYYKQMKASDMPPSPEQGSTDSTIDLDFSYENVTVNGTVKTKNEGKEIANPSICIPTVNISIIQTTDSLNTDIVNYVYRVNSDTVTIKGMQFQPCQVRYEGAKARNEINTLDPTKEIYYYTHQFRCICHGEATWNKIALIKEDTYELYWDETDIELYESKSFSSFLEDLKQSQGT